MQEKSEKEIAKDIEKEVKAVNPNFTKLSVNNERFWAEDLGNGQYKVANCLVCNDFSLNDIIDKDGNVLERWGRPSVITYKVEEGETPKDIKPLVTYLEEGGVQVEGLLAGMFGVTIPNNMTDKQYEDLVACSPRPCEIVKEE